MRYMIGHPNKQTKNTTLKLKGIYYYSKRLDNIANLKGEVK